MRSFARPQPYCRSRDTRSSSLLDIDFPFPKLVWVYAKSVRAVEKLVVDFPNLVAGLCNPVFAYPKSIAALPKLIAAVEKLVAAFQKLLPAFHGRLGCHALFPSPTREVVERLFNDLQTRLSRPSRPISLANALRVC